ncbi:MAG: DMT family transporter [Candidatus Heimdallarchaeaceae archaeon]
MDMLFTLSVVTGILSFTSYNIGFAIEKQVVSQITQNGEQSLNFAKLTTTRKWLFGLFLTVVSVPLYYVALMWAPLIAISPLVGTGLVAVVLYSHIRMKQYLSKLELITVIVIIIGMALGSVYAAKTSVTIAWENFVEACGSSAGMTVLIVGAVALFSGIIMGFKLNNAKSSISFSIVAGLAAGFQTVVVKALTLLLDDWKARLLLTVIFAILLGITAVCSTFFLQLAFRKAKITGIMALYNSLMTFYPIVFGGIALKEWYQLPLLDMSLQIIGIIITMIGIILISIKIDE